jgi:hypothetical protein
MWESTMLDLLAATDELRNARLRRELLAWKAGRHLHPKSLIGLAWAALKKGARAWRNGCATS